MAQNRFRAVALLDRDGTVIEEKHYLADPAGVELIPEAAEAIRILNDEGIAAVLTTNQSGVGRGLFTEETLGKIHQVVVDKLTEQGARLDGIYYATSLPDAKDPRRKPDIGMYQEASRDLGLEGLPVYAIGDMSRDVEMGVRAGGKGIRVLTGQQLKPDPRKIEVLREAKEKGAYYSAENLMHAVHLMLADMADDYCEGDMHVRAKFADMYSTATALQMERLSGNRIVMANGTFDLLHGGHVSYLIGARQMGDKLVVALNSDAGVRRLKGANRPVLPEWERIQLIANMRCVDYVTLFHEDTADHVMDVLRPDVHAKGTDYRPDTVPEGATAQKLGLTTAIAGADKENSSRDIIGTVLERSRKGLL